MPMMLIEAALLSACVLTLPVAALTQETSSESGATWSTPAPRASRTVSADLLRHPISSKTQHMLQRALEWMRSGKHQEAIHQLKATLTRDPKSAAYVHSLLGFEYLKTDQFAAAVDSFEQAIVLLPHDATNHSNLGISLAGIGDYKRAEQEVRRAQQLAPDNPIIRRFLDSFTNQDSLNNQPAAAVTPE